MDKYKLYKEYVLKYGLNNFLLDLISALDKLETETTLYINSHPIAAAPAYYNDELKTALANAQTYIETMIEVTIPSEKSIIWAGKHDLLNNFEAFLKPLPKGFKRV